MDHPGKGKQTRSPEKKMVVCVGKRKEGGRGGEERSEENVTLVVCLFQKNGNLGYEYFKTKLSSHVL